MSLLDYVNEYRQEHVKPITKLTHFIGIPLIILSIEIILILISPVLVWVVLLLLFLLYIQIDVYVAIAIGLYLVVTTLLLQYGLHYLTLTQSLILAAILFVFGWVMQLLGHHHEHNRPAFLKNIIQLIIGPFFLMLEVFFYFGLRQDLKSALDNRKQRLP